MIKLKRSECAVLPLVLEGEWYDMIASGEKREEYRDYKTYWIHRIANWKRRAVWIRNKRLVIGFSRGYKKPDMFFLLHRLDVREWAEHPEWGEPERLHFALVLRGRVKLTEG